jgi:hypothetical protein
VAQTGLAQADMTADDGGSGDVTASERQQDEVACGGDLGRAGVAIKAAESGADVGWLGSELRAEAWSTAGAWALYRRLDKENAQAWMQATRRWWAEAVGGGSEGTGAASCFPGSELQLESRADVAQADVLIGDGDRGSLTGSERRQDEVVNEPMGGGSDPKLAPPCAPPKLCRCVLRAKRKPQPRYQEETEGEPGVL